MIVKVAISSKSVKEVELSKFCNALQEATGCHITINQIFDVEVDDPEMAAVLQAVYGDNNRKPLIEKPAEKTKATTRQHHTRQDLRYQFVSGPQSNLHGKEFTAASVSKMLKAGSLAVDTHLNHPEKGEVVVVSVAGVNRIEPVGKTEAVPA
jgi:hypothetical protein